MTARRLTQEELVDVLKDLSDQTLCSALLGRAARGHIEALEAELREFALAMLRAGEATAGVLLQRDAFREAPKDMVAEVEFKLRGGDIPEERCGECGEYGSGMLRDATARARALLEKT